MISGSLNILFSFCLFSILGWVLEVSYRSLRDRRFVNPGLLKGPYLILYGAGALILMGCVSLIHEYNFLESNFLIKVFVYFAATTGIELISGFNAQYFFHVRLWDYSDQRFQYKGHICLKFSIYWILLAFVFEYFLFPLYQILIIWLPHGVKILFVGVVASMMFIDLAVLSVRQFLFANKWTKKEEAAIETEFLETAAPLLDNPTVKALSQYNHHRGKTRLDHVKEVAWLSFLWGKRLSLDCSAIVRGALLHDLFFYDWLREGPRLHGFRHHNISLKNARKVTFLSKKEEDIIKKHMWPLTIIPPRYPESFVVSFVDTFCSTRDYIGSSKGKGDCSRFTVHS
ncbi:MAG: phosphohydrolase [Deltaproteobacteria bacterium]|nr:MAG: phosphohydrolase [Deltaproteobacteria bacterium]